jgi:hypothetical protein
MVEPQEQEEAAAIAVDLAAAYELVCRARDCRAELGSAMEVDGQQGAAAAAAAVASGIMEKVVQLEAKVRQCVVAVILYLPGDLCYGAGIDWVPPCKQRQVQAGLCNGGGWAAGCGDCCCCCCEWHH